MQKAGAKLNVFTRVVDDHQNGHSSYDELLGLNNSVSIHHRNLQIYATGRLRVYTGQLLIF